MKYTVKENTPVKHVVEFEVPADDFENYYTGALKSAIDILEIPGFRKGKVPANIAEQHINSERIISDAAEDAVAKYWNDYLKETRIEAISQPELQVVKIARGNPFVFIATVEILSSLELPDVKKVISEVKKQEVKVEEKEIDDAITWLRNSRAILTEKETEPAAKGDYIEIDFSFQDVPATFSHLKGVQRDAFIVGRNNAIEGLDEAVIGMKKEEEKSFEGKIDQKIDKMQPEKMLVKVNVKIVSIQKMDLPELTDEWVKSLGRFETIDALREDIRKGLSQEKEIAEANRLRVEAIDKVVEKVKFEIPSILLRREEDNLMESLRERVNYEMHMDLPKYFEQINKTEEEVKKDFEKMAVERMQRFLVMHQISKNENIIATDEEIKEKVDELLIQYPGEDKSKIDMDRLNYMVADDIVKEKIFAFLGL
ncbi:MAG: trigger factor [Candidatus Pacebacteria bacterium]|nr:trigger factor [Candidatus Paceibacterota bacterium]